MRDLAKATQSDETFAVEVSPLPGSLLLLLESRRVPSKHLPKHTAATPGKCMECAISAPMALELNYPGAASA